MKNVSIILIAGLFLVCLNAESQTPPVWTRDINSLPDSAFILPERTLNDDSNHVFVLSTYQKVISPGNSIYKIYLDKYDETGTLIWSFIYDNGGTGLPRGYDMVMDHAGNCYITGAFMANVDYQPLLLKVNAAGNIVWQRDSTTTFNIGNFNQVFFNNNYIYTSGTNGIAKFNLNGSEQWSFNLFVTRMAVDNAGQSIVSILAGTPFNILRFDSTGVLNFSDSTIYAKRIATDIDNSFYLITDNYPVYDLVKYDSSGNFAWSSNSFRSSASFGDISFDILTDYSKNVILVGLSDTIYKLTPSGNLIWKKSMHGLDSYLISAKITFSNLIAVAGTPYDTNGYYMKVVTYNLNGDENWAGIYNSNPITQEYTVDLTIDNSGVYAIENNNQNTTLAKFNPPFSTIVDYNLICVDSVWYDTLNPAFINVRIFNGSSSGLNYPSEMGVSSTGDTVINPHNEANYFAQLGNSYLTYHDSISIPGITDFSSFTFLISQNFGDTIVPINLCFTSGINSIPESEIKVYPNPVHDALIIENSIYQNRENIIQVFNSIGSMISEEKLHSGIISMINVSGLADGIYFLRIIDGEKKKGFKFVKQ